MFLTSPEQPEIMPDWGRNLSCQKNALYMRVFKDLTQRPGVRIYAGEHARAILLEPSVPEGLMLVKDPIVPLVNYQLKGYALVPAYPLHLRQ